MKVEEKCNITVFYNYKMQFEWWKYNSIFNL